MNLSQIQRQASPNRSPKKQNTHHQGSEHGLHKLVAGQIIAGKFKLIEKVGQGSFGMIFKTENMETGEIFATKFEKKEDNSSGMSLLVREIKVLIEVQGLEGFPEIAFYGRDEHYNYFMLTYLGLNLEQILKRCNNRFSIGTVLKIAIKLIERLKQLHNKNFIHRDLKPDNIVIGYDDIDQIYLIDFGLSKYYRDSKLNHIAQCDKKGIIGTARYASLSAHLGKEQSRRDDIESLGYVLVYLAKGTLPWVNMQTQTKSEKYQKIKEYKVNITLDKLCEGLPKCFLNLFIYARGLDFVGEPDYNFLRDQFQRALTQEGQDTEYEWEKFPELKRRKLRYQALLLKSAQEKQEKLEKIEKIDKNDKNDKIDKNDKHKSTLIQEDKVSVRKTTEEHPESRKNSFLNVPLLQNEQQQVEASTPDQKKSRNFSQNISTIGTSQINNYQASQINQQQRDNYKKFATERRQQRNYSINPSNVINLQIQGQKSKSKSREQSPVPKVFIKQATTKTERKMAFNEIEDDYKDFDDLDQIASEETHISFQNIVPNLVHKKSVLTFDQLN